MSLANKIAKYGATPLNGGYDGRAVTTGARMIGPPTYMGDARYMGDPGIFGSIFKVLKGAVQVGTGIAGSLGVPGASAFSRFLGRRAIPGASTQPVYQPPMGLPAAPLALPGGRPTFVGVQAGSAKLGLQYGRAALPPQLLTPPVTAELPMGTAGGFHLNKSDYFLKDGTFIARGSRWVKNRRRNPGNMRALSRSLGRIKSAKKMATVLGTVSIRSACPPARSRKKK